MHFFFSKLSTLFGQQFANNDVRNMVNWKLVEFGSSTFVQISLGHGKCTYMELQIIIWTSTSNVIGNMEELERKIMIVKSCIFLPGYLMYTVANADARSLKYIPFNFCATC